LADRPILVHREISKINEELVVYPNIESQLRVRELGEFVIVVGKSLENKTVGQDQSEAIPVAVKMFDCLTNNDVFSQEESEVLVSNATSLEVQTIRKAVKKARIARKRLEQALS
jgi:16S rRNA C1402 (ribose-2'-O) methylase RsmI